jgi:hypothetical protein
MLRLRSGPQDLPGGWALAALVTAAYLAQGLYADQMMGDGDGALRSVLSILLQFGIVAALLQTRQLSVRLPQTISALAGTGFIFGLVALLILSRLEPGQPQPNLVLMYLALFFWSLAVDGHIYRHALSIKMRLGVLLAVLIFGVNFVLMQALFG